MMTKEDIIEKLNLSPLPGEGGFFRRTWASELETEGTPAGSAIYYMITDEERGFSALHSLPKVEIYHFYAGSPVHLWLFDNKQIKAECITLGNRPDRGEIPQKVIEPGVIQGSELAEGEWALLGTTMVPAYCDSDYTPADRGDLLRLYPQHRDIICRLCRQ